MSDARGLLKHLPMRKWCLASKVLGSSSILARRHVLDIAM